MTKEDIGEIIQHLRDSEERTRRIEQRLESLQRYPGGPAEEQLRRERDEARKAARFVMKNALGFLEPRVQRVMRANWVEQYPWLEEDGGAE